MGKKKWASSKNSFYVALAFKTNPSHLAGILPFLFTALHLVTGNRYPVFFLFQHVNVKTCDLKTSAAASLLVHFPKCVCVFSDFLEHDDLSCKGLAVTPDHINEDDDRSSHASSSDWAPQPQIGNPHNSLHHPDILIESIASLQYCL